MTPREQAYTAAQSLKSHAPDLNIRVCGAWVWISGPTFAHRDLLRFAGCKWSKGKEQWYLACSSCGSRRSHPYAYIVSKYGEDEVRSC